VGDLLGEVGLGDLLHLAEDHGGDFFGGEGLFLALDLDGDDGGTGLGLDLEGEVLDIGLDILVVKTATDETLSIEDGVGGVGGVLVLGGISDETLILGEGDIGRGDTVTLVVGDDLDTAVLVDTDARVGGSKIDTDNGAVGFSGIVGFGGLDGSQGDQADQSQSDQSKGALEEL